MRLELVDIVRKVIGPISPLGESHADEIRLRNVEELLDLMDELMSDIHNIAESDSRHEASMKKLGVLARSWLNEQSEDAFRAGMLESADIVDGYSDTLGGKPLHDIAGEISSAIREAAELGAWAELLDALRCAKNSR